MLLGTSFNREIDGESASAFTPIPLTVVNGDFETGDTTGWSTSFGTLSALGSRNDTIPYEGSYFGACAQSFAYLHFEAHYQNINLVSDGVSTSDIDAGNLKAIVNWYQANDDPSDKGCIMLKFYDGSSNLIAPNQCDEEFEITPEDTWEARSFEAAIPPNTRIIGIILLGRLYAGSQVSTCFDNITATVDWNDISPDTRTSAFVAFRSSTASPPSSVNEALGTTPSIANLKDQDGNNTGWTLGTQAQAFAAVSNTGGTIYARNFWYCTGYAALTVTAGTEYITLRIGGLNTGKTYDLTAFCNRGSSSSDPALRDTDVDVGGAPITIRAMQNITLLAEFTSISPDGSGNIDLTIAKNASAANGYINAFQIWEN